MKRVNKRRAYFARGPNALSAAEEPGVAGLQVIVRGIGSGDPAYKPAVGRVPSRGASLLHPLLGERVGLRADSFP